MQGTVLNTAQIIQTASYDDGVTTQITMNLRIRHLNNHRYIVEAYDFSKPVVMRGGTFRIYITKRRAEIVYAKMLIEFSG